MADKPFRVLLDLTDLSLDTFKYVWINVSPRQLKTISDLKMCVLQKISLERTDIELFVRDGLLLDEETIIILREDDIVKVKYRSIHPNDGNDGKVSMKETGKNSRKRNLCETDVNDINKKRYKSENVVTTSNEETAVRISNEDNFNTNKMKYKPETAVRNSNEDSFNEKTTTKKEKRKKNSPSFSVNTEISSTSVEEIHEIKKSHKKKDKKKTSDTLNNNVADINFGKIDYSSFSFNGECSAQKQNKNISSKTMLVKPDEIINIPNNSSLQENNFDLQEKNVCLDESENVDVGIINSVSLNNRQSSKRKRKRKRKQTAKTNISDKYDTHIFESFSESVDENINRKHILYSLSPVKIQESNDFDHASEFQNPSTTTSVLKEDKFSDVQSLDYPKVSTPAQSNTCDDSDGQVSLMPCRNFNLLSNNENGAVLCEKSTGKNTASQIIKNNKPENNYEDLPDMTSLPQVGTYIAYKTLELDDNYHPKVTDYKEGIIEDINPSTEEIKIHLCEEIIIPGRTGKFENLEKDEIPPPTVKRYDFLKWSEIISPKFFNHLAE